MLDYHPAVYTQIAFQMKVPIKIYFSLKVSNMSHKVIELDSKIVGEIMPAFPGTYIHKMHFILFTFISKTLTRFSLHLSLEFLFYFFIL